MNKKELWDINLENNISIFIEKNLTDIKLFFIVFAVNIVIFGQKIFFLSLATDDYRAHNYVYNKDMYLARMSGRWAKELFDNYIFVDELQVLPYIHSVIGVLAFTLIGFLTAKYFKRANKLEIVIITLLISASPMFAHNLYFSLNFPVWFTAAFAVIGFLMFSKTNKFIKLSGFVLMIIAIGNYQTIVQVIAAMIIFKAILELMQVASIDGIKDIFLNTVMSILFIALAYLASVGINEYILHYNNLTSGSRYKTAENIMEISVYIDRVISMYRHTVHLHYFNVKLLIMYKILGGLSIFGIIFITLRKKTNLNVKFVSFLLIILLFLSIPIIVNLPLITGNWIPPRAHYAIGWILAGLFAIQMSSFHGIFKTLSTLLTVSIIIVSIYYINIFFDAANRQTSSDISRANQIVNRIRMNKNYITEPMQFKIVGRKNFSVIGWKSYQQALNTDWSKYETFKYFTDFKFTAIKDKRNENKDNNIIGIANNEYHEVKKYLIKKGEIINAYPGKNSIIVYKGKAILFLDSNTINAEIRLSKQQ